jgi:hypothetical protein
MPLINTFLWVTLTLVILLSLQLIYSYHRAEHEIMRKAVKKRRYNRYAKQQTPDNVRFSQRSNINTFWTVGQPLSSSDPSMISYYLPASQSAATLNQQSKMAAVSDCQSCA